MATKPAEMIIYDEIEARAGNIQKSRGYHTSMAEIKRSRLTPFVDGDWPKFSFWPQPSSQNEDQYGMESHSMTIIMGYFQQTMDEPFADLAAKLKADVVAAMNRATVYDAVTGAGPSIGHKPSIDLGGLVESFRVTGDEPIMKEGQAPFCGVLIRCEVKYKSVIGDPFTVLNE